MLDALLHFTTLHFNLLLIAGVVFALLLTWHRRHAPRRLPTPRLDSPVRARWPMTRNELEFFGRLKRALPRRYDIAPQVAMGALLEPRLSQQSRGAYMRVRSRFAQKICDYVLLDRGVPIVVIELDDRTHDVKKDQDRARDALLAGAGISTLRFDSRAKPSASGIRRAVRRARGGFWL